MFYLVMLPDHMTRLEYLKILLRPAECEINFHLALWDGRTLVASMTMRYIQVMRKLERT